jgi:serine/threonine protein kinase
LADVPGATPAAEAERRIIAGRYEIVRELGSGSSARTLLCTDLRDGRSVAVKEMHIARVGDWKHLELFEREAKTLAKLAHPGIPRVFDFFHGDGDESALYIVQELVDGASLQQRMDSGPLLGQDEIHQLALGVLDILEYLHGRAPPILHRDIKPSNVLIRSDGPPALIDFGGVCVGWRPPEVAGTTVVGTFGYMPPEQLVGQGGTTSDLYALGATLLHLVTGRAPSDFPFDSGRIEVPANLPIQPSLARLIEALLRPAPRDRPQSATAARRILRGESPGSSTGVALGTPSEHHRLESRLRDLEGKSYEAIAEVVTARRVAISSGDGPHFVEMGEPPRDPDGEFRDVYRNLIQPLLPAHKLWSSAQHAMWVALQAVFWVGTFGVGYVLHRRGVHERKKKYDRVFREGTATRGTIRSAEKNENQIEATFKYEFEVGGTTYVALMDYAKEMTRYWGAGDTVPVLYDPEDPRKSCFVYR